MGKRALLSTLLCAASVFWLAPASIAGEAGYRYDSLGRLHQVGDDAGNVATYDYDAVGNILSVTRTTDNDPLYTTPQAFQRIKVDCGLS